MKKKTTIGLGEDRSNVKWESSTPTELFVRSVNKLPMYFSRKTVLALNELMELNQKSEIDGNEFQKALSKLIVRIRKDTTKPFIFWWNRPRKSDVIIFDYRFEPIAFG